MGRELKEESRDSNRSQEYRFWGLIHRVAENGESVIKYQDLGTEYNLEPLNRKRLPKSSGEQSGSIPEALVVRWNDRLTAFMLNF